MRNKILAFLIVICIVFSLCFTVNASDNIFQISTVSTANVGETFLVTIKACGNYTDVGGIRMALSYDTSSLKYINGSRCIKASGINESDATPDSVTSAGRLHFVWESGKSVNLNSDIITYQFTVLTAGRTKIYLNLYELYKNDSKNTPIINETFTDTANVNVADNSLAITSVINKILSIGTVTYTDECKSKIDDAFNDYSKLKVSEKNLVTNYNDLVNALNTYNSLKAHSIKASNIAEADAYRNNYAYVINLTKDTVKIEDSKVINEALKEWEEIKSNDVKGLLISEKNRFKMLLTRIAELERIKEDEQNEQELMDEANGIANDFRNTYKYILGLTVDTVTTTDRMGVSAAISEIESYSFVNTYVADVLKSEKELLDNLLSKIDELKLQDDPQSSLAVTEADNFMSKFGWLINMSVDNISSDDATDIAVANAFWDTMSDEAKALLPGTGEKLTLLKDAAETSDSDEKADSEDSASSVTNDVSSQSATDSEAKGNPSAVGTVIKYVNKNLNPMVIWSIVIFSISICALAVSTIAYILRKKLCNVSSNVQEEVL